MPILYTIGYERTTIETVLASLSEYRIETVLDVRRNPISRKPGFSKKKLTEFLNHSYIQYEHYVHLGVPNDIRKDFKNHQNLSFYFDEFSLYLENHKDILNQTIKKIYNSRCALLCFEREYVHCHRSIIVNHLIQTNKKLKVHHIYAQIASHSRSTKELVLA